MLKRYYRNESKAFIQHAIRTICEVATGTKFDDDTKLAQPFKIIEGCMRIQCDLKELFG